MNTREIIGIGERRSGVGKTGKAYDFTALYCTHEAKGVKGHAVEEIMFSHLGDVEFPKVSVGDKINVSYDKRGYIQQVDVVSKSNDSKGGMPKI